MIVKSSSRGDILQALCILPHLKALAPKSRIDWIIEKPFCELTLHHSMVHRSFVIDTKAWRKKGWREFFLQAKQILQEIRKTKYDVVFDLQGNTKSALFTFFAKAKTKVGFKHPKEWPNKWVTHLKFDPPYINIRSDYVGQVYHYFKKPLPQDVKDGAIYFNIDQGEKEKIKALFAQYPLEQKKKVLICPQSAWENKKLSIKTLKGLIKALNARYNCFFFIAWGSTQEQTDAKKLEMENAVVIDRYLLTTLHYLMQQMDLVLAMDSISLHMAAVANCATLSIFGPTSGLYYSPKGKDHQFVQGKCPYHISFKKQCPQMRSCPTGACMKELKAQDLINQLHFDWEEAVVSKN